VKDSLPEDAGGGPLAVLAGFRREFHASLTARRDEIFELTDAVLCAGGPVRSLDSESSPSPRALSSRSRTLATWSACS
jgi:hypothetical protein